MFVCFFGPNFTFNILQFTKSAIFPFLSRNDDLAPFPNSPFKAHDVYNELLILFYVTVDWTVCYKYPVHREN